MLPLTKSPLRSDPPPPLAGQALSGLDRLLRLAAARGASTLYLSSGTRPSIRVDGELQALDSTPVLGPNDVESLLLTLMPERNAEALRTGSTSEWICDFPDLSHLPIPKTNRERPTALQNHTRTVYTFSAHERG